MYRPASSTTTSSPGLGDRRGDRAPAPEPTTATSHSSPSSGGVRSPSGAGSAPRRRSGGRRHHRGAPRSRRPSGRARRARRWTPLITLIRSRGRDESPAASSRSARNRWRASRLERLNRHGNGSHSNARSASGSGAGCAAPASGHCGQSSPRPAPPTRPQAAGRCPVPSPPAKARSVRSSAALSPGRRLQVGAATGATLPESDHSNSATPTRKPSTMKLSR